MGGLVDELQRACLDSDVAASGVLEKAYIVARKLGIKEFELWVSKEINGYTAEDQIPEYRFLNGQVKVWNPVRGWIPVVSDNAEFQAVISRRPTFQPISELEDAASRSETGSLMMTFPPEQEQAILGPNSLFANPKLHLPVAAVRGLVAKVRHIVLRWCLDLEEKGVRGEGMTFSENERRAAESVQSIEVHYHGNVSQSQVATHRSSQTISSDLDLQELKVFAGVLRENILKLQLASDQQAQVLADLASIECQLAAPKPSGGVIAEGLRSIRNVAEGAIGSLVASGLLHKLPRMW